MKINEFYSAIQNDGIALTNAWLCRLTPPPALSASGNSLTNRTGGNRFNVSLPGFDLSIVNSVSGGAALSASLDLGNVDIDINLGTPVTGYTLTNTGTALERINMFCESCGLPERDVSNYEFSEYGEMRSFGHKHVHTPMSLNYYCARDLAERSFFEQWQNLIFNPANKQHGYYNDYISEMEIVKYSSGWEEEVAVYKFHEVYPSRVGRTDLRSFGTEIARLQIMFNYRTYERIS